VRRRTPSSDGVRIETAPAPARAAAPRPSHPVFGRGEDRNAPRSDRNPAYRLSHPVFGRGEDRNAPRTGPFLAPTPSHPVFGRGEDRNGNIDDLHLDIRLRSHPVFGRGEDRNGIAARNSRRILVVAPRLRTG